MLPRLIGLAALLNHPRARHLLIACGLVLGLVLGLGAAWLVVVGRQDDLSDSMRELQNLSLVLAEETDRAFQSMELVQVGLIDHFREMGIDTPEKFDRALASVEVRQDLQRRIASLPQISAIALVGNNGYLVNRSTSWPPPHIDASDRDFFQALTKDPRLVSFIGVPVKTRSEGAWALLFARAFTDPHGHLIGIVTTILDVDTFERLFAKIAVEGDPTFALFRADGALLAHYPGLSADIGRDYGETDNLRVVRDSVDRRVVVHRSLFDGKMRLIAPHSVSHFPLMLTVTNTEDAALAFWRWRMGWMVGVVTLAELVLAGTVILGVRQLRGQERLIAADAAAVQADAARTRAESELAVARQRETSEREAHRLSQRLDVAVSNMLQGLLMVDTAGRLLVLNRRFIELFGLPADAAQTLTDYAGAVDMVVRCGIVTQDDMAAVRAWRQSMIAGRAGATFEWELASGRSLMVTHRPMSDGWLTTYEDVTERRRTDVRMAYMARHDALTDLPNRVLFREKLDEALAHARHGNSLALLCLDLDQFKAVNDTLGHPVGDALLQAVARRLSARVRETDSVARLGGDEFAVVQAPIDKPTEVADLAERLIAVFDEPFEVNGHQVVIGTSIGIAFAPQDGLDADQLLKNADLALYRAKSDGRGMFRLFHTAMDAEMQARRLLELDLRQALRSGQFELFYQPLIDLHSQTVSGFEALLRWNHPERGMVSPGQFIPLAEEIGAIVPIGEWVLRQACAAAASWQGGQRVSVNLSPVQFKSRNLVASVAAALHEARLAPGRLELEITETVMLQDTDATLATLHELKNLGVSIAMDDFGTGYSSLSYLRRFPFDRIKIDQSFVREIGEQRDCGAIIRAVIALSHEFGMATTAEGVETRAQLCALALAGCSDIQGYLFSRPVPLRDIPAMLRSMPLVADLLPLASLVA
jgi:diguanylate cyclase (GGDEF)-like protein